MVSPAPPPAPPPAAPSSLSDGQDHLAAVAAHRPPTFTRRESSDGDDGPDASTPAAMATAWAVVADE